MRYELLGSRHACLNRERTGWFLFKQSHSKSRDRTVAMLHLRRTLGLFIRPFILKPAPVLDWATGLLELFFVNLIAPQLFRLGSNLLVTLLIT